ncbi:hypothetical protein [Bacillus sp. 1006-3]|uniref:hypothetical protein n=1 Tax=Bacillus sp. 1006-3 TaxID=2922309 RepID=UPI001F0D3661|nr:hypothetical protein [Bacillus sp. 1006-3]MCH4866684.1 hypothetical protein [Bacillus sp. 1006-3]
MKKVKSFFKKGWVQWSIMSVIILCGLVIGILNIVHQDQEIKNNDTQNVWGK